jgi:hypothetical protein
VPFTLAGFTLVSVRFTRDDADVSVNTFCFEGAGGTQSNQEIVTLLEDFYQGDKTGNAALAAWLSPAITGGTAYMRQANAAVGTAGEEYTIPNMVGIGNGRLMPDAAVCMSVRGEPPVTKRRRGRVFLGPFAQTRYATNEPTVAPASGGVTALLKAAVNLQAEELALQAVLAGHAWMIASRAGNTVARVRSGYCDDAFDTQRRRDPVTQVFGRHPNDWFVS